jgi:hypothetical protein
VVEIGMIPLVHARQKNDRGRTKQYSVIKEPTGASLTGAP